jgi:hypothetical protein
MSRPHAVRVARWMTVGEYQWTLVILCSMFSFSVGLTSMLLYILHDHLNHTVAVPVAKEKEGEKLLTLYRVQHHLNTYFT